MSYKNNKRQPAGLVLCNTQEAEPIAAGYIEGWKSNATSRRVLHSVYETGFKFGPPESAVNVIPKAEYRGIGNLAKAKARCFLPLVLLSLVEDEDK